MKKYNKNIKKYNEKIKKILNENKFVEKTKSSILKVIFGRAGLYALLILAQVFIFFGVLRYLSIDPSVIFGSSAIIAVISLLAILSMDINPYEKLSWFFIIAIFPTFGIMFFILSRIDIGKKIEESSIMDSEEETNYLHTIDENLVDEIKNKDKEFYNLVKYLNDYGSYPVSKDNDAKYYRVGDDCVNDIIDSIKSAKDFIFVEFFIIHQGYFWGTILEELAKKASEGIEVRLMYDGTNAILNLPKNFPEEMENLGIKCKVFSPIYPIISTYYNNRDHRKILVVDGREVFTGGVNLADEYINVEERFGHWKDTFIRIKGPAVQSFTIMFLQLWDSEDKEDLERYLKTYPQKSDGYIIGVGDNPIRKERVFKNIYMHILDTAKDYAYIMTPYLIIDNEMLKSLTFAAKRGVDVRIILPAIPDKKIPYMLAKSHYKKLIESGVKIYEYLPGFIHAKTWVSDDKKAVVGSVNVDYRALYLNFECGVYIHKHPVIKDILKDFEISFDIGKEIKMRDVKSYPLYKKIIAFIVKPFAPLM